MNAKRVASILLLVVAVVATGFIVRSLNDPQRGYRESGKYATFKLEGQKVAPFEAKLVGSDESFTRDSVDKPTLFVFFGTFCPHCQGQMPIVRDLAKRYDGRAHVFAVNAREYGNMSTEEREQRVAAYLAENDWADLPTLLAPKKMQSSLSIEAVPTVMLLGADHKVRYVGLANHSASELASKLDGAL